MTYSVQLRALAATYRADPQSAERILRDVHARVAASPPGIWIHRAPLEGVLKALANAEARRDAGESLPLFGVPFAVKDNIDVAGMPTTAACPTFEYLPERSATVVERLLQAGAIVLGKTNLDQFATGLVGVRSPYGICRNPFNAEYISGGSSSGSAVAVATGLVSFALGTDTAGSGRVPAGFNNIVGLKPTLGLVSTRGVVPACRTLDSVSIFAASTADAFAVLDVAEGFDAEDPFSRPKASLTAPRGAPFRVGVPKKSELEFYGDVDAARSYDEAVSRFEALGARIVSVEFAPFRAAANLLYAGPWVAERLVAAGALLESRPEAIHPAVRKVLRGAPELSARDAFEGVYKLAELRRKTESEWTKMDALLVPTSPTIYSITEILRDPIERNTNLGHYTNFVNLLDLSALAVPAGFRSDGLPVGVTLIGRRGADRWLGAWGGRFHAELPFKFGATQEAVDHGPVVQTDGAVLLAVAGAHLAGQPLNHQLTSRGAELVRSCRTSVNYKAFALRTAPPKPGLVFDAAFSGAGIEVEVWTMSDAAFGSFVNEVPAPLTIGTVVLEDGARVKGFLCEPHGVEGATDITHYGGWRAYLSAQ